MTHILPPHGLAAASAGWKAGHAAILSGDLVLAGLDESARIERLAAYAADRAREYMRQVTDDQGLTPAQGAQLFLIYIRTFGRGALDQEMDCGALFHGG